MTIEQGSSGEYSGEIHIVEIKRSMSPAEIATTLGIRVTDDSRLDALNSATANHLSNVSTIKGIRGLLVQKTETARAHFSYMVGLYDDGLSKDEIDALERFHGDMSRVMRDAGSGWIGMSMAICQEDGVNAYIERLFNRQKSGDEREIPRHLVALGVVDSSKFKLVAAIKFIN